jgi:hypothetical protein
MTAVDCGELRHSQCATATFPPGQVCDEKSRSERKETLRVAPLEMTSPGKFERNMKKTIEKTKPAELDIAALRHPRSLLRAALIVAAYLCVFIILDFFSQQFEELRGIVAWYPPAGLTYTLLLVFGVGFTPAVTIALFVGSVFIYHMPQPP